MITCTDCGRALPDEQFYVQRGTRTGRATSCRACHLEDGRLARTRLDNEKGFGVELEFYHAYLHGEDIAALLCDAGIDAHYEDWNQSHSDEWKITTDSSIDPYDGDGWEAVSPVLYGTDGLKELRKVMRVLRKCGCETNYSCGVHVHHGTRWMPLEGWKRLARMYVKHESLLDELFPEERRRNNNEWAHSLTAYVRMDREALLQEIDNTREMYDMEDVFGSRYVKLNLHSWARHGTVEFRQHEGTLDFAPVRNWIAATQTMVLKAAGTDNPRRVGAFSLSTLLSALGVQPMVRRGLLEKAASCA